MITEVAVGVVFREDGAVLIGQRLQGKPYAGWWEFPGGKFEQGEDAAQALVRELDEELGIEVLASRPWVVREHLYEHAHVRLHFRRVIAWRGSVRSREGQAFVWQKPSAIDVAPLLPAALAPIAWLGLPPEYAISAAATLGVDAFLDRLAMRLRDETRPLRLLQLREPDLQPAAFESLFTGVCEMARAAGTRLLVNSRHPQRFWQLASQATGGGVHYTGRDLAAAARAGRPALALVGASCHTPSELALAGASGADFAVYGPVQRTDSHPDAVPKGWSGLQAGIASTPVPVYALGGLGAGDLDQAMTCGAHGIASRRAAWSGR